MGFISIVIVLFIIVSYRYYTNNFTNSGILKKVTNQDGYSLSIQRKQIPIEIFVKPNWIPFHQKERKDLNKTLLEKHSTNIVLDNTWNRGNDIYFSFHATFDMHYRKGEFLYNGVFNDDGSITSPSIGKITLFDKERNSFPTGQIGYGPGADFSFGVQPKDQKFIKDGFYVKYTGYILYNYSKK